MTGKRLLQEKTRAQNTKPAETLGKSWYLDSLESAPFGVLIHDSSGKILFFNDFLENLSGYSRTEIPDIQTWIEKIYPDLSYQNIIKQERETPWPDGELRIRESIITAKNGQKLPLRFSSISAASGIRTVMIQPCEVDRKTFAGAIAGYEKLKTQFHSTPTPLLSWIRKGNDFVLAAYNKAAEKLTAGKISSYLGQSVRDVMNKADLLVDDMKRCLEKEETVECEEPCYLPGAEKDFAFDCAFLFVPPNFAIMHISTRTQFMRTKETLLESERRHRELINMLPITIFETDEYANVTFCNRSGLETFEYTEEDLNKKLNALDFLVEEDHERAISNIAKAMKGEIIGVSEYVAKTKSGRRIPIILRSSPIYIGSEQIGLRGFSIDVSELKAAQDALKKAYDEMESKVAERTNELEEKTKELMEVNTALRVLLRDQQTHKTDVEEQIRLNTNELILPHLIKLQNSKLTSRQEQWVKQAVKQLERITSPLGRKISNQYAKLTPTELQVADLIKNGKSTKEIADILDLAVRTIESHRKNIRNKLGLKNQKINLRTHLLSLEVG